MPGTLFLASAVSPNLTLEISSSMVVTEKINASAMSIVSVKLVATLFVAVLLTGGVGTAQAQFVTKWLAGGSFQAFYNDGGATRENAFGQGIYGYQWPGLYPNTDMRRSKGFWVAAKNFVNAEGQEFAVKVNHIGPRSLGADEFFPTKFTKLSKREPPVVTVDGLNTFDEPAVIDEVDPSIKGDRMIHSIFNSQLGITSERKIFQFNQGYHDNYHVTEYVFTNTGNVDEDEEIELPDQTLEGVYFFFLNRYGITKESGSVIGNGVGWGINNMNDAVGDGMEDYDADFRAQFAWHGKFPTFTRWNNIGAPAFSDSPGLIQEGDSLGRLTAAKMIGRVILHADASAGDESDDPGQPSTMTYVNSNDERTTGNDPYDVTQMQSEYDLITKGRVYPHQADLVVESSASESDSWAEKFANQQSSPQLGTCCGGWSFAEGFGPYTLEPGENVRIVIAEGANGLTRKAAVDIGEAYKELFNAGNEDAPIPYDADGDGEIESDERMSKNMWAMTARDSLFKTFRRAIANYESNYNIPQPPLPPKEFHVTSGTDKVILNWQTYSDAQPQGFEVYRAQNNYYGAVTNDFQYERIASLGPDARAFEDTDVNRGISYFYYIQAVGEENADPTGNTPTGVPLKSNRYFAQTYDPAFLKRSPGTSLSDARVVPNPYDLGSAPDVRWPGIQDRLAFLDVPGECTIKIYTEIGELVETIEHTDGSGDAFWDLTTSYNQLVASGVYMAIIEDHTTGEQITKKFVVIR